MTDPAVVWFVAGLLTLALVVVLLVALIRHVIVLGRAVGRFQDEVGSIAQEIGEESRRAASSRTARRQRFEGAERGRR